MLKSREDDTKLPLSLLLLIAKWFKIKSCKKKLKINFKNVTLFGHLGQLHHMVPGKNLKKEKIPERYSTEYLYL